MSWMHGSLGGLAKVLRAVVPAVVALALLVLVIAWLAGVFEEKIEPQRREGGRTVRTLDASLTTDVVHDVTKAYIDEAVGTLRAASRTAISSKVLATIDTIAVTAGDQVAAGDALVTLSASELEARFRQAEQSLTAALAVRDEAEQNFRRIDGLFERNATSKQEVDRASANYQVAESDVLRARQAIREAEVMLSYTSIKAPKDGRVVDRLAEPGDMARPGEPLLVLYDASSLRLEAPVQERLAVQLKVGDKLNVYVDAIQTEVEATIDEIVPQADAPSRSFLVKASVPRAENLYEGMFGRLRIPAGTRRHLCLATAAIRNIGQLEFVDVVAEDNILERRFIKTGRLGTPHRIEVLSGLQAGERVVLYGDPQPERDGA